MRLWKINSYNKTCFITGEGVDLHTLTGMGRCDRKHTQIWFGFSVLMA